jgi:hypothetical protein
MIAKALYDHGMRNLTLWEIDSDSLDIQRSYFSDADTVTVERWDALDSDSPKKEMKFDIILDKGFMDVFHRQGSSIKAMSNLVPYLRDGGLFIALSMFHRKWKRFFPESKWEAVYGYIAVPRYSRTRPSVESYKTNIAVIVAILSSNNNANVKVEEGVKPKRGKRKRSPVSDGESVLQHMVTVSNVSVQPLIPMKIDSFPMDASYF